jgi:DedD protein
VSNQELPAPAQPTTPETSRKGPVAPSTAKPGPSTTEKPATPSAVEQKAAPPPGAQKPAASAQPPASAAPAPPAPARGFIVQVGVFMSGNNAHVLQKKLAEQGIPTYTETRVLVGPFNDRAEADAVVRQLKDMGLAGVVVAPPP